MGEGPALVVVSGHVASGKSTISRALAERLDAVRLEADRVRGVLLEAVEARGGESGAEARWRKDLAPAIDHEVYGDLLGRAAVHLDAGRSVVLDACFPDAEHRRAARALAARHGVPYLVVRCEAPEATIRERLAERDARAERPGWGLLFDRMLAQYEPPLELAAPEWMEVDSAGPPAVAVESIVARLAELGPAVPATRTTVLASAPRVVSFDCWSTLLAETDWPWAHALRVNALRDAAREAGLAVDATQAETVFNLAWEHHMAQWQSGRQCGAEVVALRALSELGLADRPDALAHLVRRFEEASHTGDVVALEGARELLASLRAAGIPCVLVCDTGLTPGRVVRQLLAKAGLLPYLRALAFSDEVGFPKPDPRIFHAAIDPLGVVPTEVVHVGDLRRTDVAGARALGMVSVRIRAHHDDQDDRTDADHVVDSHAELGRLLGVGA